MHLYRTLPSNLALCVNPAMDYVRVQDPATKRVYIVAEVSAGPVMMSPADLLRFQDCSHSWLLRLVQQAKALVYQLLGQCMSACVLLYIRITS